MAKITFQGNPVNTTGTLPERGTKAPGFKLTKTDMSDTTLNDYKGKKVILNIFPSIDTSICASSERRFNEEVQKLDNTVVLSVSKDLPFALQRFCAAEGLDQIIPTSDLRIDSNFGNDYGVLISDSALAGLFSRAVVVLDENGQVIYTEQVPEIGQEPDYDSALKAVI